MAIKKSVPATTEPTNYISVISSLLVSALAIASFTLSYSALREVAYHNGVPHILSYIWPILLDGALIIFSVSVIDAHKKQKSTGKQWGLVSFFTILTIIFNIIHAADAGELPTIIEFLLPYVVGAIAPLALFFSFEILMDNLKTDIARKGKLTSISQLSAMLRSLSAEVDEAEKQKAMLEQEVREMNTKETELASLITNALEKIQHSNDELNRLNQMEESQLQVINKLNKEIDSKRQLKETIKSKPVAVPAVEGDELSAVQKNAIKAIVLKRDGVPVDQISGLLDKSTRTIERYLSMEKELNGKVKQYA